METQYPEPASPRPPAPELMAIMRQVLLTLDLLDPLHGTTSSDSRGTWLAESLLKRLESKGYGRGACEWALHVMTRDDDDAVPARLLAVTNELPRQQSPFGNGGKSGSRRLFPHSLTMPRIVYVQPLKALWSWHERQAAEATSRDVGEASKVPNTVSAKGPTARAKLTRDRHEYIDKLFAEGKARAEIYAILKSQRTHLLVKNQKEYLKCCERGEDASEWLTEEGSMWERYNRASKTGMKPTKRQEH